METPSTWSTVTPGAVLGQSSTHSQGSYSLSVRPSNSNGFTPIKSVALTTLPVVSPTLAVDMMLPTFQPNPWWYGTAQAYIDCPSRGIYSQFLNQVELTGRPLAVWTTVNFTLTNTWIAALLQAGYSDLTVTVVLNVQVPTTGIYYVDNLRFVPVASNGCGGRPNGTSCTDNSACTVGDTCQSGSCHSGTAVTCTASDQCHDVGTCDPATGVCSNPVKPGTPPCNDGNACTQDDKCQAGVCAGGAPVNCDDANVCTNDSCNPTTGCVHANNTWACDDGNACTTNDTCAGGLCVGGPPLNCDDGNVCTDDSCSPTAGCVHANNTGPCTDGNACTQNDACQAGDCVSGPPVQCTPQDVCHVAGTCDPATGQCSNPPKTPGPTDVIPTLLCVNDKGDGHYEALFGYTNPDSKTVHIPFGEDNRFLPAPAGLGQTEYFFPGTSPGAFSVLFDGNPVTWSLPGGCATASLQSPPCPTNGCGSPCRRGEKCVGSLCITQCGDGLCAGEENCQTCPDCVCQPGKVCYGNTCATPARCGTAWECGSGVSFGVAVDCGECAGGKTCIKHVCK